MLINSFVLCSEETQPSKQWPSIHQRSIIAVVGAQFRETLQQVSLSFRLSLTLQALSSCALLLAVGPAAYCWLNQVGNQQLPPFVLTGCGRMFLSCRL